MKKVFTLILIIFLAVGTLCYVNKNKKTPTTTSNLKKYRNVNLGISFSYPNILTASTTAKNVTLHHEVPFTHHDFCDFKGEVDTTINTLTDFNVSFHIVEKNVVETMKIESPYIPEENFVNGEVVPSPGFIDTFEIGELKGFKIFEGAEGCGHTTYYLTLKKTKTLVVVEDWITIFSGAIDAQNKESAEAVQGVINKEKSEEIFSLVLGSLKEL